MPAVRVEKDSERVTMLEGKVRALEEQVSRLGQTQKDEMNSLRSQVYVTPNF